MGVDSLPVRFIDASTAEKAMIKGAIQNIREGQGTVVDAARIFRLSPEIGESIGLKAPMVETAKALANLSEPIWQKVYRGEVSEKIGEIIGELVQTDEGQEAALKMIEKRGKNLNEEGIRYAIRFAKSSQTVIHQEQNLFGAQEIRKTLAIEKAKLADFVARSLSSEKSIFNAVARGSKAIAEHGVGEVNQSEATKVAKNLAQAQQIFDRLADKTGPIGDAISKAAEEIGAGENETDVRNRLYREVIAEIAKTLP